MSPARTLVGLAAAAVLGTSLYGCTSADSNQADPTPSPTSPSPSASSEPQEIEVAVYGDRLRLQTYRKIADAFTEAHPEVEVTLERHADAPEAFTSALSALQVGLGPDVFLADQRYLPELVESGGVEPVDRLLEARGLQFGDDHQRMALTSFSADNRLQCMPAEMSPKVVYLNTDLVPRRQLAADDVVVPNALNIIVLALAPLMAAAIFYTKTRSIWLGAGCAMLLLLALTLRGRVRLAVLGSMVAAALVVGVTKMESLKGLKREGTASDTRQSADMRKSFVYTSWKMFQDRPLVGFGFGQYARAKLPYLTDQQADLKLEQIRKYVHHNTYLAVLTETGLAGFSLLVALQLSWIYAAWKLVRSDRAPPWARRHGLLLLGLLAIVFWQMMGHEITFTPIDQSLVWFLAGVTINLAPLAKPAKVVAVASSRRQLPQAVGG